MTATTHHQAQLLVDRTFPLGENPLWDEQQQRLLWTDIDQGELWSFAVLTGDVERLYQGPKVGGFTMQEDGSLLLFRVNDVAVLRQTGDVKSLIQFDDEGTERFNDVIASTDGSVFAGTIGKTNTSGGFYHVDRSGRINQLFTGTGISNGMGFSPDLRHFYWTCSTTRRIFRFRYDRSTSTLSDRELLYQAEESEGVPDGLTVDVEGGIWSARWGGYRVVRHRTDGTMEQHIDVPVERVSSICIGGPDNHTAFITTAGGGLYRCVLPVAGKPEFRSAVCC